MRIAASLFGHITSVRKPRVLVQLVLVSIGLVNNLAAQERARGHPKQKMRLVGAGQAGPGWGTSLHGVGLQGGNANKRGGGGCGRCGAAAVGLFVIVWTISDAVRRTAAPGRRAAHAR